MYKVGLHEKLALIDDYWCPRIVGEVNDTYIKVAKFCGEFVWHCHTDEDEMMMVLRGEVVVQFRDRDVLLREGELIVIPHGVEHCPKAVEPAEVMLFEPKSTVNTGTVECDKTVAALEWI